MITVTATYSKNHVHISKILNSNGQFPISESHRVQATRRRTQKLELPNRSQFASVGNELLLRRVIFPVQICKHIWKITRGVDRQICGVGETRKSTRQEFAELSQECSRFVCDARRRDMAETVRSMTGSERSDAAALPREAVPIWKRCRASPCSFNANGWRLATCNDGRLGVDGADQGEDSQRVAHRRFSFASTQQQTCSRGLAACSFWRAVSTSKNNLERWCYPPWTIGLNEWSKRERDVSK
ncbi:hypothetical protein P154DRAFT_617574 [Amniculicola lignicola CBS 123094]|uniref:Uncharacterized protein n=1 Tax=Amniculicola lignicola CBS 123094 TaxID=1392246 RepID=A0A6A5WTY8_9PLEO|nr:hypothetical protein P154DRAFT_617574 [Amniculicola lignicola CBS 123094]